MKSNYSISSSYVYFTAFVVLCCFCVFVELNDLFCIKSCAITSTIEKKKKNNIIIIT